MNSLRKWRSKKFSKIVNSCQHTVPETFQTLERMGVCVCARACMHRNDSCCTSLVEPCRAGGISVKYETLQGLDFNIVQPHPFKSRSNYSDSCRFRDCSHHFHCPHLAAHPASAGKVCQPETLCRCDFNVPLKCQPAPPICCPCSGTSPPSLQMFESFKATSSTEFI